MFIVSIGTEPVIMPSVAGFYIADFVNGVYYINGTLSSEIDVITNPSKIIGGEGLVVDSTEDIIFQSGFLSPITDITFTIIVEYETKGMLATDAVEIFRLYDSANPTTEFVSLYQGYGAESAAQHLTLMSGAVGRTDQFVELTMPNSGRHIAAYSKPVGSLALSLDGKQQSQDPSIVLGPLVLNSGKSVVYQANVELVIRHIRILPFVFSLDDLQTVANFNSPRPTNDNLASAASLADGDSLAGSTVAATSEVGEPNHASIVGGCSAWWRIDAVADGTYTITLSGDDVTNYMDPLLAVYTGTAVNALGLVASTNGTSVSFTGAAGTTYYVAVDDHNGPTCGADFTIGLAVSTGSGPPANDNFANAIALTSGGTALVDNTNASAEGSEQFHTGYAPTDGGIAGKTVWYKYTPVANETTTIETFGTYTDTFMTIWTGSALGSLTEVAFDDDSTPTQYGESKISFSTTAGVTYYIQIDTYAGYEGEIRVNVNRENIIYPAPPEIDNYIDSDEFYPPRTGNLYPSLILPGDVVMSPYIFRAATFDPATVSGISLDSTDLIATGTGTTGTQSVVSTTGVTTNGASNPYFEFQFTTIAGGDNMRVGFQQSGVTFGSGSRLYLLKSGVISNGSSTLHNIGTINAGDWIGVAARMDGNNGAWFKNLTQGGNWNGVSGAVPNSSGFDSAGLGSFIDYLLFTMFGGTGGAVGNVVTANFGQSPFVGAVPSGHIPGWF